MVDLFKRLTRAIRSWSIFFKDRKDRKIEDRKIEDRKIEFPNLIFAERKAGKGDKIYEDNSGINYIAIHSNE